MLKGISKLISPELLKILMEMGHGDEIVLVDANFPASACAQRLVRSDGIPITDMLSAILELYPLDHFVKAPVKLMDVVPGDDYVATIWDDFKQIVGKTDTVAEFELLERFEFYEAAKKAYAIVATGEARRYANIILKKGIID
jgi:L-fucose mutarotase